MTCRASVRLQLTVPAVFKQTPGGWWIARVEGAPKLEAVGETRDAARTALRRSIRAAAGDIGGREPSK